MGDTINGNLVFFHRFKQGGLGFGSGTVNLVGQNNLG